MKHFYVLCEAVDPGLIESERTVTIRGFRDGHEEYVRGAADSIIWENGQQYLSIGVVQRDIGTGAWLVQFPTEADSGAYRMWVPQASVIESAKSLVPR